MILAPGNQQLPGQWSVQNDIWALAGVQKQASPFNSSTCGLFFAVDVLLPHCFHFFFSVSLISEKLELKVLGSHLLQFCHFSHERTETKLHGCPPFSVLCLLYSFMFPSHPQETQLRTQWVQRQGKEYMTLEPKVCTWVTSLTRALVSLWRKRE